MNTLKNLAITIGLALGIALPAAAQTPTYSVAVPSWNSYGPYYALSNTVNVPTNTVAGVQVGTNTAALSPVIPIKPGVAVAVWANYTGTGTGTSNVLFNFGGSPGNVGSAPGTPFSGTNVFANSYGTNFSTITTNLTVLMPLRSATNNFGYAVIPASSLVGVRAIQLISISTDATNALGLNVTNVLVDYSGP